MDNKQDLQKQFINLFLKGKCSQREIAKKLGISEQTICKWAKGLRCDKLITAKQMLSTHLVRLLTEEDYKIHSETVSLLITDIERLNKLILK